jgi:hypothetical protein
VDGLSYPSAEHYMMAAKARVSGDAEAVEKILAAPYPGAATALGRQVRGIDVQATSPKRWPALNLLGFAPHSGQSRSAHITSHSATCSSPRQAVHDRHRPVRNSWYLHRTRRARDRGDLRAIRGREADRCSGHPAARHGSWR